VLDSWQKGSAAGYVGPEQLGWLGDTLARRPDVPAFVCLHHPPIPVGITTLDPIRLLNGAALGEVISRHTNVERVLTGHLHRHLSAPFAGTLLSVAPSTYRQSDLTLGPDQPFAYVSDPTGFLLHLSTETGWVTHAVAVGGAGVPMGGM